MRLFQIGTTLVPEDGGSLSQDAPRTIVLSHAELAGGRHPEWMRQSLPPSPKGIHYTKAESHRDHISGTVHLPKRPGTVEGTFSFALTGRELAFVDDSGTVVSLLDRLRQDRRWAEPGVGVVLCDLLELLLAGDARQLEQLETQVEDVEAEVMEGNLDVDWGRRLMPLRKVLVARQRHYAQMNDLSCELEKNANRYFSPEEVRQFHLLSQRLGRLMEEARMLREYCTQIQELLQAEMDLRQNSIMKVLTVVTTIFLPLTLVVGWYGMNFTDMPELSWPLGYPMVIGLSIAIVVFCLWLFKKNKFL